MVTCRAEVDVCRAGGKWDASHGMEQNLGSWLRTQSLELRACCLAPFTVLRTWGWLYTTAPPVIWVESPGLMGAPSSFTAGA